MALTSRLGSEDSRLANVILGKWDPRVLPIRIGSVIKLGARYQPNLPIRRR